MKKTGLLLLPLLAAQGQEFATRADAYVESHVRDGLFRGVVLVVRDGRPAFQKAYGKANDEWDIPNALNTRFRINSMSKQFTAAAILQLVEKGNLALDDPIAKYYPEAPARWARITIHHLLNHTSGLPSYIETPGFWDNRFRDPWKPIEIIRLAQELPPQFEPGEKYLYSDTGYLVLGYVIERTAGVSYGDQLRENIFAPLGMNDSGVNSNVAIIRNRASGYTFLGENAPYVDNSSYFAAQSLYSTATDLLRWDQSLYSAQVLSRASIELMTTPGKFENGFGLAIRSIDGKRSQSQGGGGPGFNSMFLRFPDDRVTVIVLANQNAPAVNIARNLAAMYFGADIQPRPLLTGIKLPAEQLEGLAGRFQMPGNVVARVWRDGARVYWQTGRQQTIEIFPMAVDRFFARGIDLQVEFHRDASGRTNGLTAQLAGRKTVAKRIGD